jgi:short-subunit dehydrogenase
MGAYASTKAALMTLADCLRPDLLRVGIGIRIVNPGFLDTSMAQESTDPMPFIMSAGDAAARVLSSLRKGYLAIAFPWQMAWMIKAMRVLPYSLYSARVNSFILKKRT